MPYCAAQCVIGHAPILAVFNGGKDPQRTRITQHTPRTWPRAANCRPELDSEKPGAGCEPTRLFLHTMGDPRPILALSNTLDLRGAVLCRPRRTNTLHQLQAVCTQQQACLNHQGLQTTLVLVLYHRYVLQCHLTKVWNFGLFVLLGPQSHQVSVWWATTRQRLAAFLEMVYKPLSLSHKESGEQWRLQHPIAACPQKHLPTPRRTAQPTLWVCDLRCVISAVCEALSGARGCEKVGGPVWVVSPRSAASHRSLT